MKIFWRATKRGPGVDAIGNAGGGDGDGEVREGIACSGDGEVLQSRLTIGARSRFEQRKELTASCLHWRGRAKDKSVSLKSWQKGSGRSISHLLRVSHFEIDL